MTRAALRHATSIAAVAALLPFAAAQDQAPPGGIQGTVEGGMRPVQIAVPDADATGVDAAVAGELAATLRSDLEFSGYFDVIDPALYRLVSPAEGGREPLTEWQSIGSDALVRLAVRPADARLDVQARLYDTGGGGLLFAQRYAGSTELVRRIAHTVADDLVKHYTGRPGIATTRIAFVRRDGDDKEIFLMDYDGERERRLTFTDTINLAPAWSPDGNELAYLSWRTGQPQVQVISAEGELRTLATVASALSAAPDWSPDGRRLVYSADVGSNSELFVIDRATGRNTRITHNAAIDTAPAWSPNGRQIAFTSDRSGTPQIYVMDVEGVNIRRVSWVGNYCDSAAWSPDGALLAYASRIDGRFQIVVYDVAADQTRQITRGGSDHENPRWAPDGRHIVYAGNRTGGYQIYTMRADGSDERQLTRGAESFTPDWSR